jgi:hypothetical protein
MTDLPVVDPTTGLVDPDEVDDAVREAIYDRLNALGFDTGNDPDGWERVIAALSESAIRVVAPVIENAAMAEKLRQAEAERDEARADRENYAQWLTGRTALLREAIERLAAYEQLVTAARVWRGKYGNTSREYHGACVLLVAAVDARLPQAPVEAPTDALQPRTDEMP